MCSQETMERMNAELHRFKVDLATSNESLDNANRENTDLKIKLQHFPDVKTILETNILNLEWKNSECIKCVLVYQVDAEKATVDERLKELVDLKSDYNELHMEKANLEKEKGRLNANLTNIRIEKKLLEKSVNHVCTKCSVFEDEIDKHKFGRDGLLEEIGNFRTSNEHF